MGFCQIYETFMSLKKSYFVGRVIICFLFLVGGFFFVSNFNSLRTLQIITPWRLSLAAVATTLSKLNNNLIHYYTFDNVAGTFLRDFKGTKHGEFEGSPTWSSGRISNALRFIVVLKSSAVWQFIIQVRGRDVFLK